MEFYRFSPTNLPKQHGDSARGRYLQHIGPQLVRIINKNGEIKRITSAFGSFLKNQDDKNTQNILNNLSIHSDSAPVR